MLTELILDKLGVFYDDLAKKKHGNSNELTYGELIEGILRTKGSVAAYTSLNLTQQTFNRLIHKVFPDVKLNGGNDSWFLHICALIEHKYCSKCDSILPFNRFAKDPNASKLGLKSICKTCTNEFQLGHQFKYADSFHKSQENNKDKIYARNAQYRAERNLRLPDWADLEEIERFYANCKEGEQVDHELPLKGEFVSGLHVRANLQYLPIKENLSKGNRIDLDAYNKKHYGT